MDFMIAALFWLNIVLFACIVVAFEEYYRLKKAGALQPVDLGGPKANRDMRDRNEEAKRFA